MSKLYVFSKKLYPHKPIKNQNNSKMPMAWI